MMIASAKAIYSWLLAAHRALAIYHHAAQDHPLEPERAALHTLYMAMSQYYAEHRDIRMQADTVEFLQAMFEAMHSDDVNHYQALEAAVHLVSRRRISQEPGVSVALAQAMQALQGRAA